MMRTNPRGFRCAVLAILLTSAPALAQLGPPLIVGTPGDDALRCEGVKAGQKILGMEGDDTLTPCTNESFSDGGPGLDTLLLDGPAYSNVHMDGQPGYGLGSSPFAAFTIRNIERVILGAGGGSVTGTTKADFIETHGGGSVVQAGKGDDTIRACARSTQIWSGPGHDTIETCGGPGSRVTIHDASKLDRIINSDGARVVVYPAN